jgi:hypothetical protein
MTKTVATSTERRSRRSAADWQVEVSGWRSSGLSAAEYAKTRGIHPGTLMGWASRLARQAVLEAPRAEPKSSGRRFVPVRVLPARGAQSEASGPLVSAEVILSSGRRVRISGELRLDQLGQLLDALEGAARC